MSFFGSILELTDRQIEDLFDILLFPDNANVQSAFINDTQLWNMARKYQLSGFFLKSLKFNSDSNLKEKLLQLHKNYLIKYMSMIMRRVLPHTIIMETLRLKSIVMSHMWMKILMANMTMVSLLLIAV